MCEEISFSGKVENARQQLPPPTLCFRSNGL
jgi:hypothetical protein